MSPRKVRRLDEALTQRGQDRAGMEEHRGGRGVLALKPGGSVKSAQREGVDIEERWGLRLSRGIEGQGPRPGREHRT